ncbi:Ig-like domain repeat protein, partial [Salmonella enterica]|nr:Ig-like domain repeat protein [Salmonella enterica]
MSDMKSVYVIKSFKVSGFDLIITQPDGKNTIIKNGLADAVLGKFELKKVDGTVISVKDIVAQINIHTNGIDSVFLSDLIDELPKQSENSIGKDSGVSVQDKLAEISTKNDELSSQSKSLSHELDKTKEALSQLIYTSQRQNIQSALEKVAEKSVSEKMAPQLSEISVPALSAAAVIPTVTETSQKNSTSSSESNQSENAQEDKTTELLSPEININSAVNVISSSIYLSDESDSGVKGDWITNAISPVFEGLTAPLASVSLYINDFTYNTVADQDGRWAISVSDLNYDGIYSYSLQVQSVEEGISTWQGTGSLTIDRSLPPVVSSLSRETDTGLSAYDNITNNTSPVISGTTKSGASITIQIENNFYNISADSQGEWAFKIPDILPDGKYDYHLSITDHSGNTDSSDGYFVIDTSVGELSASLSALDISQDGDNITHSSRPILVGKVESGADVYVEYNGHTVRADVDGNGNWSLVLADKLVIGENKYTVLATDIAGNTKNISGVLDYRPVITSSLYLREESDSGIKGDFITNSDLPVFEGVTSPFSSVKFTVNGLEYATRSDDSGYWSVDVENLVSDGLYGFTLHIIDNAGSEFEQKGSVTIDRSLPKATSVLSHESDSGRFNNDGITNTKQPSITGQTKPDSEIVINFHGQIYKTSSDSSGAWVFKFPESLSDGNYKYSVTVTDRTGNSNTADNSFIIDTSVTLLTAMLSPGDRVPGQDSNVTGSERPVITGKVEVGSEVVITYNGHTIKADVDTNGNWSVDLYKGINIGKNDYIVTATDMAGNTRSVSGSVFLSYQDSTLPLTSHLSSSTDTGASNSDGVTRAQSLAFDGVTKSGASVNITIDGKTYTTKADDNGNWSLSNITGLSDGVHSYLTTATLDGKSTSVTSSVVIDRTAPTTTLRVDNALSEGKNFFGQGGTLIWFRGTTEPGVKVTMNGAYDTIHTTTADKNGNWALAWNSVTGDGSRYWPLNSSFNYTLKLEDLAGNTYSSQGRYTYNASSPVLNSIIVSGETLAGDGKGYHFHTNELTPVISGTTKNTSKLVIGLAGKLYEVPVSTDGSFSFKVPAGVFSDSKIQSVPVQITAYTNAGKTVTSWINYIDVLHQTPSITADLTQDTDTGLLGDGLTSNRMPHLAGIVTGLGVAPDTTHVSISIDGGVDQELYLDKDGNWLFDGLTKPLIPGEHNYQIHVKDQYGNTGSYNGTFTVSDIYFDLSKATDSGTIGDLLTNNTHQVFVGKASAAATTVRIEIMGHFYDVTPDASGNWVFDFYHTTGIELADGEYNVTVSQIVNNLISDSINSKFIIDTTPPALSVSYPQTGFDKTMTNSPVLSGMTDPKQEVTITLDNGKTYNVVADEKGNWSQELSLPDGEYTYRVSTSDIAGNVNEINGTILIDKVPPSGLTWGISETAQFTTGDIYTADAHPVLVGHGEPGAKITITPLNDSSPGETVTVGDDGFWHFTTPSIWWSGSSVSNIYHITIKMEDGAGNAVTSNSAFQVTSTPPDITAFLAPDSDTGAKGDDLTNITTPVFMGSTRAFSTVKLTIDGKVYTTQSDQSGQWKINIPEDEALNQGIYTYSVISTDALGKTSNPLMHTINIDTNPVPLNDVHLEGYSGDDVFSNNINQVLTGTTTAGNQVDVIINGSKYSIVADTTGKWSLSVTALQDGVYSYSVSAQNAAGTQSPPTSGKFTIDTRPPVTTVSISSDTDSGAIGDYLTNNINPVLTGVTKPGAVVTLTLDGKVFSVTADNTGIWSVMVSPSLNDGVHNYSVSVTDRAGNVIIQPVDGYLTIQTQYSGDGISYANLTPESLSGTSDVTTKIQTPIFSGAGPVSTRIELRIGDQSFYGMSDETGKWTISVTEDIPEGNYSYQIYAVDNVGNKSAPFEGHLSIKTTATLEVSGLQDSSDSGVKGDNITNITNPVLSGKSEPDALVTLTMNGEDYQTIAGTDGAWSFPVKGPLPDGDYVWKITVFEPSSGTNGENTGQITIDTKAPEVHESSVPQGATNDTAPEFEGTGEAGATVNVTLTDSHSSSYTQSVMVNTDGSWSLKWDSTKDALQDGDYTWKVTSSDVAGN